MMSYMENPLTNGQRKKVIQKAISNLNIALKEVDARDWISLDQMIATRKLLEALSASFWWQQT